MLLSILIPTKDRHFLIQNCLDSLVKTVDASQTEILLGDTGTTDNKVFSLYDRIGKSYPGKFCVHQLKKYHFSSNNNALAAKAKGKHLVLLNNDTVLQEGWWKPILAYLEKPTVGAVGAKLLFGHNDRIQHAGIEFLRGGSLKYLGYHPYRGRHAAMPETCFDKYIPAVTGACLAVRRETYSRLGGLDDAYKEECQDVDFCLKLRKHNLKTVFASQSVFYHLENGTRTISESSHDRHLFVRRWRKFIDEHFFKEPFQSFPVDKELRERRENARHVLFVREEARGDVLAATAVVGAFKEENPGVHITFKTKYPELVDAIPCVDRALGMQDADDYKYDRTIPLTYENGEWRQYAHTWIEEMARPVLSTVIPREQARPRFHFHSHDAAYRRFYGQLAKQKPWVAMATGAGWREREWSEPGWENLAKTLDTMGFGIAQIGGRGDYPISRAHHLMDRSLHENIAILESARAFITVDSFPYHLGVAARVPTLLLTCKSCSHTVLTFPETVELRNRNAPTPLPGCRDIGCRQKFGNGLENRCETPILKSLSAERVLQALRPMLESTPWQK